MTNMRLWSVSTSTPAMTSKCPACSALVAKADVQAHDDWHTLTDRRNAEVERRLQALERPGDHYRTFGR